MQPNARLLFLGISLFWVLLVALVDLPPTKDWEPTFWPAIQAVAQGESPYIINRPILHPVHLYAMLAWLAPLSMHHAFVVWVTLSLGILFCAFWWLSDQRWPAALAIVASPLMLHLLRTGQVTAIELAGVVALLLGLEKGNPFLTGASSILLSAIPPNALPLLVWGTLRKRALLPTLLFLGLVLMASILVYGDWVSQWWDNLRTMPAHLGDDIVLALWGRSWPLALALLGIVGLTGYHYRESFPRLNLHEQALFVLAQALMVTPYLLSYRLLPLYVLTIGVLSRRGSYLPLPVLALAWALQVVTLRWPHALGVLFLLVPLAYGLSLIELERVRREADSVYKITTVSERG
jgi:hypothetical protein